MNNYELWISYRYLTSRHKERFISLISLISILGVAIGVMALIIVLAVMTGFDIDLRDKIIGTNSHILIESQDGITDYNTKSKILEGINGISATSPYVNGRVLLQFENHFMNLALRGIDSQLESKVTKIKDYLIKGSLDFKENGVIIGRELANYLGLDLGDSIMIYQPLSNWQKPLKIEGIFNSGMYDYDMNLIFVSLKRAQEIFSLPLEVVSGISVKLNNVYQAQEVKREIFNKLGYSYNVRSWIDINRNFFAALRLEKITMFIILTLIILVASFNIVSTLIVIVTEKVKDIGILKSIGVPNKSIKKIFSLQGLFIGLTGTFLGIFSGVAICLLLKKYQFVKLPQEIYYIDRLPVYLQAQDIFIIALCAIVISFLSTLYPASKAARLEPVEALRYE